MAFTPVDRPNSLSDLAYDQIRKSILSGEVRVGERLSVVSIAEKLNMSRSPVRAAVERIVTEGLMSMTPNGLELSPLDHQDLIDTLQVRSRLEGLAARLASTAIGADVVRQLWELHEEFSAAVAAGDMLKARRADLSFHQKIQSYSGNTLLVEELRRVQARGILAAYTTAWVPTHHKAVSEHAAIIEALSDGDPDRAERAAIAHLENLIGRVRVAAAQSATE